MKRGFQHDILERDFKQYLDQGGLVQACGRVGIILVSLPNKAVLKRIVCGVL